MLNYTIEHPLDYKAERDFDPKLVAASTSKLCRYAGRCKFFYSVAQHMILAAHIAGRLMHRQFAAEKERVDPVSWYAQRYQRAERFFRVMLMAHLHDSIEMLSGDIITPVKRQLMFDPFAVNSRYHGTYRNLFEWERAALADTYKLHGIEPTLIELNTVAEADKFALSYEVMSLLDHEHPCWKNQLTMYPVSRFPDISIDQPLPPHLAEHAWLEDYNDLYARYKSREGYIV